MLHNKLSDGSMIPFQDLHYQGRAYDMMASKAREFAQIVNLSLEQLVAADHFYRHLERSLDLTFVRALVQPCYATGGRPSIDPVVFFKRDPRDYPD